MPQNRKQRPFVWSHLIIKHGNDSGFDKQLTNNLYALDDRKKTLWQTIATQRNSDEQVDDKILSAIRNQDPSKHFFEINQQHNDISALGLAIQQGNAIAVLKLIGLGCSISSAFHTHAGLPEIIRQFKDHPYLPAMIEQIQEKISNLEQQFDAQHHHILRIALTEGHHYGTILLLLQKEVDPNLAVNDDYHILESVFEGSYRALFALICSKLSPENIHYVCDSRPSPLMRACERADLSAVEIILHNCSDASAHHQGKNALHYLSMAKINAEKSFTLVKIARQLIQSGAQINQVDQEGNTPLMLALKHHHVPLVMTYLEDPEINIYARNRQYENALSIAILGGLLPCCQALIQHSHPQTSSDYEISTTPSKLPQNFTSKILPFISRQVQTTISITGTISPIATAMLLQTIRPEMKRVINWLLQAYTPGQHTMDDPYPLAVTLNDYESIAKLLQHGIPSQRPVLENALNQEHSASQALEAYFSSIKRIENLLQQSLFSQAEQAAQSLDIITMPSHWPIQYWQGFADTYIIACLEASSIEIATQRLHRVLYETNICPFIIQNQRYISDHNTLIHKTLRLVISQLQDRHQKHHLTANKTSEKTISDIASAHHTTNTFNKDDSPKERSFDSELTTHPQNTHCVTTETAPASIEHLKSDEEKTATSAKTFDQTSKSSITLNPSVDNKKEDSSTLSILDELQSQKDILMHQDSKTDFEEKRIQWQITIDNLLSELSADGQPSHSEKPDLKSQFLTLVHTQFIQQIFHHSSPTEYIIEALRILNQCPCADTRQQVAEQTKRWFTQNDLVQENSHPEKGTHHGGLCKSLDATQLMLNTHQKLFAQIRQRPLDMDELLKLATVLFTLQLSNSDTSSNTHDSARKFYSTMSYAIMKNHPFLSEPRTLIGWLKAYDPKIRWLQDTTVQKDILNICQIKDKKIGERDEANEIFGILVTYLNESIINEIIHHPEIIHYLVDHQRLFRIRHVCTRLAQILNSYTQVRLIDNTQQRKERKLPPLVKAVAKDSTTELEELLSKRITELEDKIQKTVTALDDAESHKKSKSLRLETTEGELEHTKKRIQSLTQKNKNLEAQISSKKTTEQELEKIKKEAKHLSLKLADTEKTLSVNETAHQAAIDASQRERYDTEQTIETYRTQITKLLTDHRQTKQLNELLQAEVLRNKKQSGNHIEQLETSLKQAQKTTSALTSKHEAQILQQHNVYTAEIEQLKKTHARELDKVQADANQLASANHTLQQENDQLRAEVSAMLSQIGNQSLFYQDPRYAQRDLRYKDNHENFRPISQAITDLCHDIMRIDPSAEILWGGSTAIMMARKEMGLINHKQFANLCGLIKTHQEDIDITVISSQTSHLQAFVSRQWHGQILQTPKPRLHIKPRTAPCCIDLQLRPQHQQSMHPDAIIWVWNPQTHTWHLPIINYQPHQQAFLWDNHQLLPETHPSYSLYRALHQWIKQPIFKLDNPLSVSEYLLKQKLASSTKAQVSKEILAILNQLEKTSYWASARSSLFKPLQIGGEVQNLLAYLLPDQAVLPPVHYTYTAIKSASSVTDVLSIIKQHWETTETNSSLLNTKNPIDWSTIPTASARP